MEKSFEELQIKDDFMFSVVMRNPKFCKPFLERVLVLSVRLICLAKSGIFIHLRTVAFRIRN